MSECLTHLGKTCYSPHASLYLSPQMCVYCVPKCFFVVVHLQHRKVEYPAMGIKLLLCYPVKTLSVERFLMQKKKLLSGFVLFFHVTYYVTGKPLSV